jgi:alpha-amylase/alpha-mannosidase (GH57 family)
MSKKPLCVAILWHMHQPDYGNSLSGEIYLPWTRFHATKDYFDMAALVAEVPGLHLTFNLVPSLMDQLVAYATGTAKETYIEVTLTDAASLDERQKYFLLRSFFQLPYKDMVFPYPRYTELLERRGAVDGKGEYPAGFRSYTTRDYRDLQTWFNLSWCGRELRKDPEIDALFKKGKGFTEEDKKKLLHLQSSFIGHILPFYRSLMEEHGIELSVSPYYHPILPLLCDTRAARESLPHIPLPSTTFSYPADAREQIRMAVERFSGLMGRQPAGMWPSEGSISDAALGLAREAGLRWLASDEGVLHHSLRRLGRAGDHLTAVQKFSAYRWGAGSAGPVLFFRDHGMSDLIGFTYSKWGADDAASDFVHRLLGIRASVPDDGRHYVVPVILDGENAWEHYPNNGADFLRRLYHLLAATEGLKPVTMSEFLELEPAREELPSVVAGSWIYATLSTWVGHAEKNRGWEFLTAARSFLGTCQKEGCDPERYERAYREMLIAEGSDWFWWYGDDHSTQNAIEFDALFRTHLKNVYRLMGSIHPPELDAPIKKAEAKAQYRSPVYTITPKIDGKVTDYFEWLAAGFAMPAGGDSMHRNDRYFEKVHFGYDKKNFYLRLDLAPSLRQASAQPDVAFQFHFSYPADVLLSVQLDDNGEWICRALRAPSPDIRTSLGVGKIIELGVGLEDLGVFKPEEVRFAISACEKERELERFPPHSFLSVTIDPWGIDQQEWMV